MQRLRALILECLPLATENTYEDADILFYKHHRLICFIWPASTAWGSSQPVEKRKTKGVALGFNQGNRMANPDGALQAEGRKQVRCMYFQSLQDIDETQVRALLFEASMIDDSFKRKKR